MNLRLVRCAVFSLMTLLPVLTGAALAQDQGGGPVATPIDPQAAPPPASAPNPAAPDVQASSPTVPEGAGDIGPKTYSREETLAAADHFFGGVTEGLAKSIERAFSEMGRPTAYIVGKEGSGAAIIGLRYGAGKLYYKGGGGGSLQVYWQGPTVGFDIGGNGGRVFTLVYNLRWTRDLFQKFPGVDGSLYVVAGASLNYQRSGDITLAPIRTGLGLRAGASIGYLTYTRTKSYNPF